MPRGGRRAGAGRPKGRKDIALLGEKHTLEEMARTYTQVALETLGAIAKTGESEQARVSAATALLDRGYGRPRQVADVTHRTAAAEMSDAELADRLAQVLGLDGRPRQVGGNGGAGAGTVFGGKRTRVAGTILVERITPAPS